MWIWEVDQTFSGNIQTIISQGKQLGLDGFIVKAHDGSTVWSQFGQVIAPLKAAGFTVAAWGYVYANDVSGESAAAQTVIDLGADWYILDAEQSFDNQSTAATDLCTAIRSRNPKLIMGYAPFAFPNDHPNFPYAEFSRSCNVCLPQIYWSDFGITPSAAVSQSFTELHSFGLPLAPIGQTYGSVTGTEIHEFAQSVSSLGGVGISFWDFQSANSKQLQAIGQIQGFSSGNSSKSQVPAASKSGADATSTRAGGEYFVKGMPQDVQLNDWFYGAVSDLLTRGIVTAYQDGLFKPDEAITRAQAADWLNRLRIYLQQQGGKIG